MTATVTQQVIQNGPRNLVLKYTLGGLTGDATADTLVNLSSLDSTLGAAGLRLDKAQWSLTGCSCKIQWESGASNVDLLEMQGTWGDVDYSCNGGISNNASLPTGNVVFTTTGYTASGDGGHILLYFRKKSASLLTNPNPDLQTGSLSFSSDAVFLPGRPQSLVGSLTLTGAAPTVTVA